MDRNQLLLVSVLLATIRRCYATVSRAADEYFVLWCRQRRVSEVPEGPARSKGDARGAGA
jgi:hypothetical protein